MKSSLPGFLFMVFSILLFTGCQSHRILNESPKVNNEENILPPEGNSPTDEGWTQLEWDSTSYYVQNRTDGAPLEERFWKDNGIYTTQVFAGEERVEMRWDDWEDQTREYMWEGNVKIESGTSKTCIMQIKSNEDGEPIYIQVFNENGDIRNNGDSSPLATYMYDSWFNLKAAFDPETGIGRAWINDVLVKTRQYRTPTSGWYFKNGTYNNGIKPGEKSVARFRNIKLWVKSKSSSSFSVESGITQVIPTNSGPQK